MTEITNIKVSREMLATYSPAFKAMLTTGRFVESRTPVVDLYEDTGISGRALVAVFRALYANHKRSLWLPEKQLRHERPNEGVIYKIMPCHLVELLRYMCHKSMKEVIFEEPDIRDTETNILNAHRGILKPEELLRWLNDYSDDAAEGIRIMKPFPIFKIPVKDFPVVMRRVCKLIKGQDVDMKTVGLVEEVLESYRVQDPNYDPNLDDDIEFNLRIDSSVPVNRFHVLKFIQDKLQWRDLDDRLLKFEFREYLSYLYSKLRIPMRYPDWDAHWQRKPNLSTHYYLQFDQIQWILEQAFDPSVIFKFLGDTSWMHGEIYMSNYLKGKECLHEHSSPVVENDTDTYACAYDISVEELPQILLALDKYSVALPPIFMCEWFSSWFKLNFPDTEVRPEELGEDPARKLMVLLLAAHKFDHPEGFYEVTSRLRQLRKKGEDLIRLTNPLALRYPALKKPIMLNGNIMQCLNRKKYDKYSGNTSQNCTYSSKDVYKWDLKRGPKHGTEDAKHQPECYHDDDDKDGICIDCFNASLYPFDTPRHKPAEDNAKPLHIPQFLRTWGERNFLQLYWNISERVNPYRIATTCYQNGCRINHGKLILRRSSVNSVTVNHLSVKQIEDGNSPATRVTKEVEANKNLKAPQLYWTPLTQLT